MGGPEEDEPETASAFEWVDPARPGDYRQENAFLQETGQSSSGVTAKKSYDILFKGSNTLTGKSSWNGPVLENGKSAVFPGMSASLAFPAIPASPVTKFQRLLLRNPAQSSFSFPGFPDRLYISDAWTKETQRVLSGPGFVTCQRRWIHVFINGYYCGVYDLEEHLDADTVSAHLLAAIPNPTAAQKEQYKASNILFGKPTYLPDYSPAALGSQWWFNTVVPNALAVRGGSPSGTPPAPLSTLAASLDISRYIDYVCTVQVTEDKDSYSENIRVWRHPEDLKWRCIAWDGDYIGWHANAPVVFPFFLNGEIVELAEVGFDQLAPHSAVKFAPEYVAAFSSRLKTHLVCRL